MKKIKELSVVELGSMSESQFEHLLKLEKMENGIPLVNPEYPVKKIVENIAPTEHIYCVGDFFFKDKDKAKEVSDILKKSEILDVETVYSPEFGYIINGESIKNANVEECNVYNKELYEKWRAECSNPYKNESTNAYNERIDAYNKIIKTIYKFEKERIILWNEAVIKYNDMLTKKNVFWNEYYPLAGDNTNTAMNFMKKAYVIDEITEEFILNQDKQEDFNN